MIFGKGLNPRPLKGNWDEGMSLNVHTLSSQFIGYDDAGHAKFDSKRSELGEWVFQLKYRQDTSCLPALMETLVQFIADWKRSFNLVTCVPPSRERSFQALPRIARELASHLAVKFEPVLRIRKRAELKSELDPEKRAALLCGAFRLSKQAEFYDCEVLVLDDLYRSGATLNEVCATIRAEGRPRSIKVIALTRTRVRK